MKRERLSEASPAFRILSVEPRYGHWCGCPRAWGAHLWAGDNADPSLHRHMLIQVRSRIFPLPLPFCPCPGLAPSLPSWTSVAGFALSTPPPTSGPPASPHSSHSTSVRTRVRPVHPLYRSPCDSHLTH